VNTSWDTLKILSDPTRLRLIALVMREELSVAELQEILGMGQSRISSQLALLRQASLVADRRDGKKAFYSLRPNLPASQLGAPKGRRGERRRRSMSSPRTRAIWTASSASAAGVGAVFQPIAGRLGRNHCPGRSWEAIGRLALRLVPNVVVADLGRRARA
jgi:DNA-binding transcriptional ArsR family regulator